MVSASIPFHSRVAIPQMWPDTLHCWRHSSYKRTPVFRHYSPMGCDWMASYYLHQSSSGKQCQISAVLRLAFLWTRERQHHEHRTCHPGDAPLHQTPSCDNSHASRLSVQNYHQLFPSRTRKSSEWNLFVSEANSWEARLTIIVTVVRSSQDGPGTQVFASR